MRRLYCLLAIVAFGAAACAARGPSPALRADIGEAETLLREGCFRCLQDALASFERVAGSQRAPARAPRGAFEASLLLAVRAKELGLESEPFMTRARALAERLTSSDPLDLPPRAYLDAAGIVAGELSGLDPEVRQLRMRRPRRADDTAPLPARAAIEALRASSLVAEYLALAIDCDEPIARSEIKFDEVTARHGNAPIIRFRLGLCGRAALLSPLREADARWSDTLFFEGRREMATRPVADVAKAAELFSAARTAFPDSDAITTLP